MIRESLFYRGHFSSHRFTHSYENDTFSSCKRVIFLRRIMTVGHFPTSKNDPRSLFCGGHYSSLHRRYIRQNYHVDFFKIPRTHPIYNFLLYNNLINNIQNSTRNSKSTSTLINPILTTIETHVSE